MKLSPLQLSHYFITELHFVAAAIFDPAKDVELRDEHFTIEPIFQRAQENDLQWQVTLKLNQEAPAKTNTPYSFSVVIVGLFEVHPKFEKERIERMVHTNASSVLYGIAREIVRGLTTRGPYPGLMLPSVSFLPDVIPKEQVAPETESSGAASEPK